MGKSNTTSTDIGDYFPSKELTFISAAAKAISQRKKELEAAEMEKAARRGELLKAVLPQFMKGQQAEQAFARERPFKQAGLQMELAELAQKGELGRFDILTRISDIENQWQIAQLGATTSKELAQTRAKLDIRLKEIDLEVKKWGEAAQNLRTRMTLKSQEDISKAEIKGRETVAGIGAESRETVAGIQRDAAMERVKALIASDERIAKWDNDTRETISQNALDARLPAGLKAQEQALSTQQGIVLMMWGAAQTNPDLVPAANYATAVVNAEMTRLNTELAKHGGIQYTPIPLPGLETQKTWGGLPIIGGKKTVPVETPAIVPGLTPTATPEQEIDYWAEQWNKERAKRGLSEMPSKSRAFLENNAGVNPDAVERRAAELRK